MAEILVRATSSAVVGDSVKDQRGCYKRGMPVVVMPDGHAWGRLERLPTFVVIKLPLISVARVEKYLAAQTDLDGVTVVRRRIWRIRWASLPLAARNTLQDTGALVLRATADYAGPYDYTWAQVRDYFLNQQTGLNETENP